MFKSIFTILSLLAILASCGPNKINDGKQGEVVFDENPFVIGEQWSRQYINLNKFSQYPPLYQKAIKATAKIDGPAGSGTAFFVGQHLGEFVFVTNHHVIPNSAFCTALTSITLFNNQRAYCKKLIVSWHNVEFAVFTVKTNGLSEKTLLATGPLRFDFHRHPRKREPLLSIGFGLFKNPGRRLTYADDEFCQVVSSWKRYRKVEGPEDVYNKKTKNKSRKRTWSFMHGCEGSQGDSGSPLISRETGRVVGVYWGGKSPKGARFKNAEFINKTIDQNRRTLIWNKFNMGAPAVKIHSKIKSSLRRGSSRRSTNKAILESLTF